MGVDYTEQYKPEHLEPFFPNEIVKMVIVVLSTLAVLMLLVILPTLFDAVGIKGVFHESQPADPTVTPPHIRPEWYFLAVYQYLKLMPQELFGMDGKALGISTQGLMMAMVVFLPFWFPFRPLQLDRSTWKRGFKYCCLLFGFFGVPAIALAWVRSTLPEQYRDFLHPMFVWSGLAVFSFAATGLLAWRSDFLDALKWIKIFLVGLFLVGFQFLAFIVVFGQGLSWAIPSPLAYTIGGIPFLLSSGYVIRFILLRIRGKDDHLRTRLLAAFIIESICLFMSLTIWAMWPAGGLYTEHGWHHEARSFAFTVLIIFAATFVLTVFLATERHTVKRTLSPEERDEIT